ncbi:MAG: MBL fold metallo-hydrolase [Clostridiales bacterium]|nr:MBL fold metallo-hydrolase [Clostridiales bacterium]
MQVERLVLGELGTNVYLLVFDKEIFVIDPADEAETIKGVAARYGKRISYVLLTHGHFDHCNAAAHLQSDGAKVLMSKTDYEMIENGFDLAKFCNEHFNSFKPDMFIEEGEITLNGQSVYVLATPGHTAGSLTYIMQDNIFCGDTLFYLSVGRSDLPTGNKRQLTESIKKLYDLSGNYNVYPGHGGLTDLEFERKNNPYVKA